MGWLRRGMSWSAAALLAACATPPEPPPVPTAQVASPEAPAIKSQPLKYLAHRKLAPLPDLPLNVGTTCKFKDPTGYRGRMELQVHGDDVHRFNAEVNIPKHGSCHFDLKDFRQSAGRPVALAATGNDHCVVRLWQQEGRVTVAFRDCEAQCSSDSFDYLWPILVDARTGKCS